MCFILGTNTEVSAQYQYQDDTSSVSQFCRKDRQLLTSVPLGSQRATKLSSPLSDDIFDVAKQLPSHGASLPNEASPNLMTTVIGY